MTFTGSLQIKGNKYYTVIFLPDKNKYEWKSTGISVLDRDGKGKAKNRKEAEKALRDRIRLHEENRTVNTNICFVEWLNKWLKEIAPKHITESTIEGYRIYMDKHILPYFKPMRLKLDQVSVIHIQGYFDAKSECLSASSLRKHRVVINQALTEACLKQLIAFNPCTCVRITQRDEDKFHGDAYTAEEAKRLLSVVDNELKPAVFMALFTGLRRSEVLGLKWDCIDFDRNTISIRNTVVKITSVIERQATKNRESRATIPLLPPVKAYLMELKTQQEGNRELLGDAYSDNGYICAWPDGKPFDPDYVTHHFSRLLKNNGLRHIRFHDLRHTCATLLLSNGVSMYQVQEYLRHADISTTINTYGHLDIRDRTNTGNRLCEILETDTSKSGY